MCFACVRSASRFHESFFCTRDGTSMFAMFYTSPMASHPDDMQARGQAWSSAMAAARSHTRGQPNARLHSHPAPCGISAQPAHQGRPQDRLRVRSDGSGAHYCSPTCQREGQSSCTCALSHSASHLHSCINMYCSFGRRCSNRMSAEP